MNGSRLARCILGALALVAASGSFNEAFAQGRPPPIAPPVPGAPPGAPATPVSQKVEIELMVVHATNGTTQVDPALAPMLKHLQFLSYTGFALLKQETASLGLAQEASFSVVGDRRVTVELIDRTEKEAKIRVRMFNREGKLLDTTVSIHRNRSFIVAGPKHEDGVLILPVTARY